MTHETLQVDVTLSAEDLRAGLVRTMLRHTPGARFVPLFLTFAAITIGALATAWIRGGALDLRQGVFALLCLAFLIGVPLALARWVRSTSARVGDQEVRYVFTPRGIQLDGELLLWETIVDSSEGRHHFFVHPARGAFRVIPKRALERPAQLRELLATHVRSSVPWWLGWASPSGWMLALGLCYATYVFFAA